MEPPIERCESCGHAYSPGLLDGFCPVCLWRGLFVERLADPAHRAGEPFAAMQLPGLTVLGEIARGGMGIVYRARQAAPEREVALKMLLPYQVATPAAKERFRAEARAIAALEHPAILPVHQLGEMDGLPWFTMKLAAGGSLAQRRHQYQHRWRAIASLVVRLGGAIQFAHDRGILHRDLKPANILFDEAELAYVSDFGLAKFEDGAAGLTLSQAMCGTPAYMAPELLHGSAASATTAADIYGLGALLYELLFERPPFAGTSLAGLLKQVSEQTPVFTAESGARVPRDLEVICRRSLAKDPADRYASARDLVADLQRWLEGRPIVARPASVLEQAMAWVRRRPAIAALLGLFVFGMAGSGWVLQRQNLSLQRALATSESAQHAERGSRRASLVAQARAVEQTTQAGRKATILALVKEAAELANGERLGQAAAAEMRDEAIAALAACDLKLERRWMLPLALGDDFFFVSFAPGLDRYALTRPGRTEIRSSGDQALLASVPVEGFGGPQNLVFSADGQQLAIVQASGDAAVWDGASTNALVRFRHQDGAVTTVSFHPDGKSWLVGRRDRAVEWRGKAGQLAGTWPLTNAVALGFSPDGARLAMVGEQGVEVWTAANPQRLWKVALAQPLHRVEWNADGSLLLAGSRAQHALYVLETEGGAVLSHHAQHSRDPARFSFHPSGRWVASIGREGTLRLWEVRTGRDLAVLPATVETLGWSADGRKLGFSPGVLELGFLQFEAGEFFREFEGGGRTTVAPEDVLVSPDGREVITVSSLGLRRWDAAEGRQVELIRLAGTGRTWGKISADGRELIYGRRGEGGWRRERTNAAVKASPLPIPATGLVADLNESGDWLVASGQGELWIWNDGDSGRVRHVGRGLGGARHWLSPDQRWILVAPRGGTALRVVSVESGQVVQELRTAVWAPRGAVPRAWFTQGGTRLLTGSAARFQLWEVGSWRVLQQWETMVGGLETGVAAVSPEGRMAALELSPDVLTLVSLESAGRLATLRPPTSPGLACAAFGPNGASLYLGGTGPVIFQWKWAEIQRALGDLGLGW